MATLAELNSVMGEPTLNEKIRGAVLMAAVAIKFESAETENHANRILWAATALNDPNGVANDVQKYVVAAKNADTPSVSAAALVALSDTDIQNYTNAAVNIFATGG